MSSRTATLLGGLGRALIVVGVLILAFAGFQLWGTNVAEARAQSSLDSEFDQKLQEARQSPGDASVTIEQSAEPDESPPANENESELLGAESLETSAGTEQPDDSEGAAAPLPQLTEDQIPAEGEAAGQLTIPAIGVTKTFVAGVSRDVLRLGPGHYPSTPLPGQPGNAAIAGHRTTHGAPFFDIDQLVPGDEIVVETLQGTFTYIVEGHDNGQGQQLGHFIVAPTNVGVIGDQGDDRLTLTACHPKYSAQQRIIVTAILDSRPAPANPPTTTDVVDASPDTADGGRLGADDLDPTVGDTLTDAQGEAETSTGVEGRELANTVGDVGDTSSGGGDGIAESLGWQPEHAKPSALWGALTSVLAFAGWAVGKVWRRWPSYIIAAPPVLASLFFCFTHIDKFIPAV